MFWQILFVLVLLIPILAIVLDSQVGRALASRLERRGLGQSDDLLQERLMDLEGEVERLSREVGRLDDQSQFLQKLLEDRPGNREALPPGEHDS
ncbi:MAG: hypothetical protein ACQET1_01690 [Gemmatimonadota bacterium]